MSRIAYVNGRYLPLRQAVVNIEDRGYQLADGVYEVCVVRDGHLVDEARHMRRLARSLGELSIRSPMESASPRRRSCVRSCDAIASRNGIVYLQVTRGVAPRNHRLSVGSGQARRRRDGAFGRCRRRRRDGRARELPSSRRPTIAGDGSTSRRCHYFRNVLAKQKAKEAGAAEAWFVDDEGYVTEGASSNAWIVTADGVLVTHGGTMAILRGMTRDVVLGSAPQQGAPVRGAALYGRRGH